jgi:hypothetical protein
MPLKRNAGSNSGSICGSEINDKAGSENKMISDPKHWFIMVWIRKDCTGSGFVL